jgi:hypothetical protein
MGTAVGQMVGMVHQIRSVRYVMDELVAGFIRGADLLASAVADE